MPLETPARIVRELTSRGYNAEREAITLLASAPDPGRAVERVVAEADDDALRLSVDHVRRVLDTDTPVSTGTDTVDNLQNGDGSTLETKGVEDGRREAAGESRTRVSGGVETEASGEADDETTASTGDGPAAGSVAVANDITGRSTGTGVYDDFVAVFRDRYDRLSSMLRPRVNARPTSAVAEAAGGSEASIVGMVSDIRSTANGHRLIELEDTAGTFPCLVTKDREIAGHVDGLLLDEVIAVDGRLSDDAGVLFVDALYFPDVPRTHQPSTADRHVQAALVSDLHVGSQEFLDGAWSGFTDWLHTAEADPVEYLLIAGDMVEGVGVYPGQDEELDLIDIYEQYEAFVERLKEVPGDIEVVMIPGNHDAVRLAEPQPAFDDELRGILSAGGARVTGNPSVVTLEGVSVLMYHGVSLDEVIAEVPGTSYDEPHTAMYQLLEKRHVAPQFGERTRVAPEERDYLVIDEVPDVFHAGHVHKLGYGRYHNVTVINSGCWQAQTAFQRRVNIDPDAGYAPIVDLDTLDVTIRKFV